MSALDRLDKMCCEPGRSPRMRVIRERLEELRNAMGDPATDRDAAFEALGTLDEIGSLVGSLQVGCCAPARLPLYAQLLAQLTHMQIAINRGLGLSH